ncbi:hypothetical protein JCGZ_09779 [Jatropha curcas]|uniref:Uncharacterized protein n=1 Tax=Jatropha curcas TaxID=180498 RepID=A0A067KWY9_JATCU|nr:hypothetical protein JCGZ_09779 [Jatropha curcas]
MASIAGKPHRSSSSHVLSFQACTSQIKTTVVVAHGTYSGANYNSSGACHFNSDNSPT